MAKVMLIDATHPEETRVAVADGRKLEEFDVEVASRRPLKGNIYLAKVTRVEPSLQAAFVEYGGNRHGFLAFSEIHPDYYRIPVADRERLLRDAAADDDDDDVEDDGGRSHGGRGEGGRSEGGRGEGGRGEGGRGHGGRNRNQSRHRRRSESADEAAETNTDQVSVDGGADYDDHGDHLHSAAVEPSEAAAGDDWHAADDDGRGDASDDTGDDAGPLRADAPSGEAGAAIEPHSDAQGEAHDADHPFSQARTPDELTSPWEQGEPGQGEGGSAALDTPRFELRSGPIDEIATVAPGSTPSTITGDSDEHFSASSPNVISASSVPENGDLDLPAPVGAELVEVQTTPEVVEIVGGEEPAQQDDPELDEERAIRRRQRNLRRYKIQEVIKRRQILLVQVTKEERGNKGAALTTYLSLAGRYCVLMPNTDRGGGISRRITSQNDRKRLKSIIDDLDAPEGMAVIVRTAGMERSRPEIKRDFEYLLRLWDEIREVTLKSTAPALIYEEASLIKRSIRDLYTRDIGDIIVAGDEAYRSARDFMRTLTPSHVRRVQAYRDQNQPLFQRYQIESQIAAIHEPVVHLKSGGYIVLNQTEALVAIDVNSGRATRERNIEETALRTNVEAAEEVARQLRLRDLAGLIVIDFIDMEENRNNATVERRIKEALKNDRARIQIGRISTFGLLEMSRQRLHPSLAEASTEACAHCHGTGRVRSVESTALHVLRMAEEEIARTFSPGVTIFVPGPVALFILNHKRRAVEEMEQRRGVRVYMQADDELTPPEYRLDRIKQLNPGEEVQIRPVTAAVVEEEPEEVFPEEVEEEVEIAADAAEEATPAGQEQSDRGGKRRRRRRGRGGKFRADEFTENEAQDETSRPAAHPTAPAAPAAAPAPHPEHVADGADDESDGGDEDDNGAPGEGSAADGDQPRRRRRRGRRGGRRRSRRQDGEPGHETQGQGDGHQPQGDRPSAETDAPPPGLGDQPDLPEVPEQWAQRVAPIIAPVTNGTPQDSTADGSAAPVDAPPVDAPAAEPRRRTRRPRRREESAPDGSAAEPAAAVIEAPRETPRETYVAPSRVAAEPAAPAVERAPSPVQVIEVGAQAESSDDAEAQRNKRGGWWRRLIE